MILLHEAVEYKVFRFYTENMYFPTTTNIKIVDKLGIWQDTLLFRESSAFYANGHTLDQNIISKHIKNSANTKEK